MLISPKGRVELLELAWPAVAALPRTTPVVFPIAALEQHGGHLPLFTDSLLLGEVVRRVKLSAVAGKVLFAPVQWLGNSHHHLDFPGTLSASPRVYLDVLIDLAECVIRHGFRRVVFLNGHGGNTGPARQAAFELRQKYRTTPDLLIVELTYWNAADPVGVVPGLVQREMGHACEWETGMMLHLAPHLVTIPAGGVDEVPFGRGANPAHRAWAMPDRSVPGHIGTPAAATAEKGDALFDVFAAGVASVLDRVAAYSGSGWDV